MRYDLENGVLVERPHCGAYVKFSDVPKFNLEESDKLLDLVSDMETEIRDLCRQSPRRNEELEMRIRAVL